MSERAAGQRVQWYRIPLGREQLSALNKRSDFWGFLQTGGYLGLLAVTGTATYFSIMRLRLPWSIVVGLPLLWFHGMCWHFLINGFHELIHDSVFKTRWLNSFFLSVFSFLGWYNHIQFWASHTEHHKFTLHPPDDLEVTLPAKFPRIRDILKHELFSYGWFRWIFPMHWRLAKGKLMGPWEHHLFDDDPVLLRKMVNWSRFVLIGHAVIFAVAMYMHWWALPVVFSFPMVTGGAIHALTNGSQHIGLRDNVPDFRLCCRTIYLNPFLQFLYWHMNYHTEHHMYAAVPCYNLPKLHRLIKDQMPHCPNGLYEAWTEIFAILKKEEADPTYRFTAELPPPKPRPTNAVSDRIAPGAGKADDADADEVLGVMAHAGIQPKTHDANETPSAAESATVESALAQPVAAQ